MDPPQPPPSAAESGPPEPRCGATGGKSGQASEKRPRGIRGLLRQIQMIGRDVASVARGRLIEPLPAPDETEHIADLPAETNEKTNWRISVMHAAAERLRGAADSYIAAKLDEIEARVDVKLDHVEGRIDAKIVELHKQLRQMRDRELRHRLRLLKITLIFTVLVAVLSLVYKSLTKYLFS